MHGRIRILCVDDHSVVIAGLTTIINKNADMEVVAVASDGREGLDAYRRHRPDVTLMDLRFSSMSGFEAIREIRALDPDARIIVLTMYSGEADIQRALAAGAAAYLLKTSLADHLIATIRDVYAGNSAPAGLRVEETPTLLSAREVEVIQLLADGLRDKEISRRLGISEETVGAHTRRIFAKLQVHDRTAALAAAIRLGIIHLD